jgi:hypothetical protein
MVSTSKLAHLRDVLTPCWRFDNCRLFGGCSTWVNTAKRRADAREALTHVLRPPHHDDRSASTEDGTQRDGAPLR